MILPVLAMKALARHNTSSRAVHFDPTPAAGHGERRVNQASPPPFAFVEGDSKDRCPDLEQFPISALCLEDRVPIRGKNANGDRSDKAIDHKERHGVERNLVFLKDPAVVNAVFLKSEERIGAPGFFLPISLFIGRLSAQSLGKHVEKTATSLTGRDKKPTIGLTALMIAGKFRNTTVIGIGSPRRPSRPRNPARMGWLAAFGLTPDIFTRQPRAG